MVFVGLFLKSIFIVIMLCAFFFIGIMIYLYMKVKRVARHFGATGAQQHAGAGPRGGAHADGAQAQSRRTQRPGTSNDNGPDGGTAAYAEIYDPRPADEANRKIISKDEGEYVDFVEEN